MTRRTLFRKVTARLGNTRKIYDYNRVDVGNINFNIHNGRNVDELGEMYIDFVIII